ncbi:MAG TPA: acetaldehyde dehydrogenase (acetylating) [Solirubrobacterales bacterium]|nr:acetaldehyde dehydrogenase (acetylating) [Solirubrobacterales bacterium]
MAERLRVAIIGSGNIGTDLLEKAARSESIEVVGMAGIDPESAGLARAAAAGITTSHQGLEDLLERVPEVELAYDATSAYAHAEHAEILARHGIPSVDLTPAALGPAVIPAVNLEAHVDAPDVNLVTCGAQATVPVVAAIAGVAAVPYAEIVSTISASSAGPGTRANIDEFTRSTAAALQSVGGAAQGKAIMLLNPAEPPILMRNTVYADVPDADPEAIAAAVDGVVESVSAYVPGYRLASPVDVTDGVATVLLEVEGAGDFLPEYAGNLDIMTSAAVRVAELHAERKAAA